LPRRPDDFIDLQYCRIPLAYSRGVSYITQNVPHVPQPSPGIPTQISSFALDFSVGTTQGTVVPQPRWVSADEVDVRRHVHDAALQLPIFFVNKNNGAVGFWLPDILQGRDGDLHHRNSHASLGGRTTTHICINVSSHSYISCGGSHLCSPTPLTVARLCQLEAPDPHTRRNSRSESDYAWPFHEARWQICRQFLRCMCLASFVITGIDHVPSLLAMHGEWQWGRPQVGNWAPRYYAAPCQDHWCCACISR
jgi:hypothetical protein